jgi:error-prone DNA polymerase
VSYLELHAASAFSFLQGASSPEALVDRAAELGYPALALLDRDGVYGSPRFHRSAQHVGIRPIIGAELTIAHGGTGPRPEARRPPPEACSLERSPAPREGRKPDRLRQGFGESAGASAKAEARSPQPTWTLPVLVASAEGYRNLCRLVTRMKLRAPKGEGALAIDELDGHVSGLVALAGREVLRVGRHGVGGLLDRLVGTFGRERVYVELQRHLLRDEQADNESLADLASAYHVPVVATNGARFARPDERPLFDVLTCIHHGVTLDTAGRRLAPNAERYLKSPAQMEALFSDLPQALRATRELADRLEYTMADLGYRFPEYPVPSGETMMSFLRTITQVGARERYRPYHDRARAQIARELDLIEKLELAGYFLIVWDIVNFCRQQGILVQGRGSAANSAVCYSLGITAVDPVGMELLFERFLSEERGEWPDIDLDLPSGDRRERVIQYVYERYGALGAGMTANVITYRGRSAAREVGKALAIDADQIDRLAKAMNHFEFVDPSDTLTRHLVDAGCDLSDPRYRHFADLWPRMQDLPRHLGQHSGGMVICQGRLDSVVPLENASMPGRVVVQWDKDDCAEMGIIKVDLLGLGMMSALQDALTIINERRAGSAGTGDDAGPGLRTGGSAVRRPGAASASVPADPAVCGPDPARPAEAPSARRRPAPAVITGPVDLAHLPPDDPAVYRMLQAADTIGVFQVESRAQMATLPRLHPERFYDLVVQVAIIRPGPIVGQMVHPFLNRRAGREAVTYPHPSLEPVLKRTLGVPLFQEQLLRMAMVVAGFTGGQAEELRRAMGFKRSEKRMRQIEVQLREGMARNGITGAAADGIVLSITSFALYGFPESHAASFALIAYASAYLKAHYPAAFYAALLNNQPMGFYHPATLVKDAQRRGVRFSPIDVQASDWLCTIEPDGSIRLGLMYVHGLREAVGRAIAAVQPSAARQPLRCPKCGCEDESMIEQTAGGRRQASGDAGSALSAVEGRDSACVPEACSLQPVACFCNVCAHDWQQPAPAVRRFASLEDLIRRTGARRDELAVLAEIGALNAFGYDRRGASWQVERAVRPSGELFEEQGAERDPESAPEPETRTLPEARTGPEARSRKPEAGRSPLAPMSDLERMTADYAGTGLTVGKHPMAMQRSDLAVRGVQRAVDLPRGRSGQRVRTAGMVITRQRPGTAKGFVFLTLEDETGIANIIVRPDLFAAERTTIVGQPFLMVEGILQNIDGVTSVKAERVSPLTGLPWVESHDFS